MGWQGELELELSFITASIRLLYSHSSETIAVNAGKQEQDSGAGAG